MNIIECPVCKEYGYDSHARRICSKCFNLIGQLQAENERLKNELLDALDLKQGKGSTALSLLAEENERLRDGIKNLKSQLFISTATRINRLIDELLEGK